MRKVPLACLAVALLSLFQPALAQTQGGSPRARWAHDGVHIVVGDTWQHPETGEQVDSVPAPKPPGTPNIRDPFMEAVRAAGGPVNTEAFGRGGVRTTIPKTTPEHPGLRRSADGQRAAVITEGELWVYQNGQSARRLLTELKEIREFAMAPDGESVSFIRGHDLYIVRCRDGETHRLSQDGGDNLFYGELDWVYQEEVYGRGDFTANWWSPNGQSLAFLRTDEAGVDTFTVVDHIPNGLGLEHLKYPKAGTTNPRATLHIARASDGKVIPVDLSQYPAEDEILIVRVGWTPEGDRCLFQVQNREQTWLDLNLANPETGACTTIIHEQCNDGWVNVLSPPLFLKDGSFLWESERTGFKHLYRYDRAGKLLATVSHGDWELRGIIELNEERGSIAFYGTTPDHAIGQSAYYATLDGSTLVKITDEKGQHQVSLNGAGDLLIDSFSSLTSPGKDCLRRVKDGSLVRVLKERQAPDGAVLPQYHQIKARDGEWLDVLVTLPGDFDPSKKYPVLLDTYSGPDAPTIRDGWRNPRPGTWYAVLNCNVRSASGRGMKYTKTCYRQFGVQELRDLEDAVDWLCTQHSWADRDRVGISGWSYGGFMAAYALTHSKIFRCGIAGAGVHGWDLYDTIYTERYMAKPQNNPDGYRISSVVEGAKDLTGDLLIVHGTMDDNVHLQNSIQLVHALQQAGKLNFQFMVYPKSRHGVASRHLNALRTQFLEQRLR